MCRFRTQPIIAKTLESIYRWKGLELRDYLTHGELKHLHATAVEKHCQAAIERSSQVLNMTFSNAEQPPGRQVGMGVDPTQNAPKII